MAATKLLRMIDFSPQKLLVLNSWLKTQIFEISISKATKSHGELRVSGDPKVNKIFEYISEWISEHITKMSRKVILKGLYFGQDLFTI